MITKGTMVDEMTVDNQERYLMCLVEEKRGGNGPDDRVFTGMVAVKLSTGDVVYDTFLDTFMRSELETRLLHIEPSEILIPSNKNISQPTEKLLNHLSGQRSTCFGNESVRIEKMPIDDLFCQDYNMALTFVSDFYESTSYLATIVELPDIIM